LVAWSLGRLVAWSLGCDGFLADSIRKRLFSMTNLPATRPSNADRALDSSWEIQVLCFDQVSDQAYDSMLWAKSNQMTSWEPLDRSTFKVTRKLER
jgi:hypothetical protein